MDESGVGRIEGKDSGNRDSGRISYRILRKRLRLQDIADGSGLVNRDSAPRWAWRWNVEIGKGAMNATFGLLPRFLTFFL